MPIPHGVLHDLSARLKDGVKLGAILDDFPGALEARRHYKTSPRTKLPAIARQILEHDAAGYEAAELRFGITNTPLSGGAGPVSGEELLRWIGEVVRDRMPRIARNERARRRRRRLALQRVRKIDDLCIHGVSIAQ